MSNVLRFKASLTTGYWDGNPEKLVRDPCGDYCLFSDYKKLQAENAELTKREQELKSELSGYKLEEDRIYEAEKLAKKENPMGCVDKAEVYGGCVQVRMYTNSMDYSAGTEHYSYSFDELDILLKGDSDE